MTDSLAAEYARTLAALEGDDFQAEVCARLEGAIIGLQTIPASPQGDGGLDACSHNGERGYCCYGPEHKAHKNSRSRESAIIKKFCEDLRRIFELETKGKGVVHHPNVELATILPKGQRLQQITLIVNTFDSHRIIGPILTKADEYRQASACQYVQKTVAVVIQGPNELANSFPISELSIDRSRRRAFGRRIRESALTTPIGDLRTFDKKMDALHEIRPDQPDAIKQLAKGLQASWRMALAFDKELSSTVPSLHESLDGARQSILTSVAGLMIASSKPWEELNGATGIAEGILKPDFGSLYGTLVHDVAEGEVARLIGECTIDWQPPAAAS